MHKREADRQQRMLVFFCFITRKHIRNDVRGADTSLNLHFLLFWMDVVLPIKLVSGHLIF